MNSEDKRTIVSLVLMFLVGVFILNVVSASNYINRLPPVEVGHCIMLKQNNNGTFANLTSVAMSNGTYTFIGNVAMTKSNQDYYYTYCNTSVLGEYTYCTFDDDEGNSCARFNVTTTGHDSNTYLSLLLILGGFLLLGFALYQKNEYLGLFSSFMFIAAGIYTMIYGLNVIADDYTRMVAYILIGLGLIFGFTAVYEMLIGGIKQDDEED